MIQGDYGRRGARTASTNEESTIMRTRSGIGSARRRTALLVGLVFIVLTTIAGSAQAALDSGTGTTSPSSDATGASSDGSAASESTASLAAYTSTVGSADSSAGDAPAGPRYIVKFNRGVSAADQAAALDSAGAVKLSTIAALRLHVVQVDELGAALLAEDTLRVSRVEPETVRAVEGDPSDSSYDSQWALPRIGWDQVFGNVNPTGSAKVAVLDTGVDASHPELSGSVVPGTSILDGSDGRTDPTGHGTSLAGIIAAATDNGQGIAGVAYAG